ncbi:MAG TPA: protein-L-isoaspartate(D-aspartate) O-methyltransferase, partial [Candidatus Hypogeohydataceae bacterium YC40]
MLWDFEKRRKEMVEYQLRLRDITDERVLAAMEKIPRHLFLPVEFWLRAYDDAPVPIGEGQTMSQPYMVAFMTQALRLKKEDKVLEIGTGSGYQTAVLAEIVDKVYTVEVRPYLAARAKEILEELGYALKIIFRISNGHWGYEEAAPYDAILVTAAAPNIPPALIDQLAEFISYQAIDESAELAKIRGTYPTFKGSGWSKGFVPFDTLDIDETDRKVKLAVNRTQRLAWDKLRTKV